MLGFLVYMISIVDNLCGLFIAVNILVGIYIIFMVVLEIVGCCLLAGGNKYDIESGEGIKRAVVSEKKRIKIASIILTLSILCSVLIPSSKAIVAIYLVPKIVANEDVRSIPGNTAKLFNKKLLEWMEEVGLEQIIEKKVDKNGK